MGAENASQPFDDGQNGVDFSMCTTVMFIIGPDSTGQLTSQQEVQLVARAAGCVATVSTEITTPIAPIVERLPSDIREEIGSGNSLAFLLWKPPDTGSHPNTGCSCSIVAELQDALCGNSNPEDYALVRIARSISHRYRDNSIGLLICEDVPGGITVHPVDLDGAIALVKRHYGWQEPEALPSWDYDMNALMVWGRAIRPPLRCLVERRIR